MQSASAGTSRSRSCARRRGDLVLAADVLYEERNAERLLELLPRLGCDVLLADPGRPFAAGFLAHWRVEEVANRVYRLG